MNFNSTGASGQRDGFCLIKSADKKINVKGVPYLDIVLADSTGEIPAKLWDYKEEFQGWIAANKLVKVRGIVSEYNGADQMKIEKIRPVTEADGVRIEDYVPSAYYDGKMMLAEIDNIVAEFKNKELQTLVAAILNDYRDRMVYWPAALKLHHAVRGGLLFHTLSVLRMAQSVCEIYPFADRELLFSGAILHDIAKISEFEVAETGIATGHTADGSLVGHLARGAMLIDAKGRELGTSGETLMLLEHMLLSHHGEPEFGAAVRPMFLEAEILSELDMLDARIYEFAAATKELGKGDFSPKQWALDNRRLYNHGRADSSAQTRLID